MKYLYTHYYSDIENFVVIEISGIWVRIEMRLRVVSSVSWRLSELNKKKKVKYSSSHGAIQRLFKIHQNAPATAKNTLLKHFFGAE